MTEDVAPPMPSSPPEPTMSRWLRGYRLVRVRLRFVAVLVAIALVVGQWEWISTHFNRWIDRWTGASAQQAVSPDTEYFCPMCPGVLSGWPDTCPVCNMPLVRRRKGEAVLLPSGVVARMQFSPQRIQLAGLQTSPVEYRDLSYEFQTIGRVTSTRPKVTNTPDPSHEHSTSTVDLGIDCVVSAADMPLVRAADRIEVLVEQAFQIGTTQARLMTVVPGQDTTGASLVRFGVEPGGVPLELGSVVRICVSAPAAMLEPFATQPRGIPPLRPGEPRRALLCVDHPDEVHLKPGKCPHDGKTLEAVALAEQQRIRWRCAEHHETLFEDVAQHCERCPDTPLVAQIVTFAPEGKVLAVPESAVIDTGSETMVYLESMPGMFDGVRVRLGPRAGAHYPVMEGLISGQRVVSRGAFLVDAESRLNPSVASAYFGAAGTAAATAPTSAPAGTAPSKTVSLQEVRRLLAKFDMPAADRELAERQRVCPVTGMVLGSMGKPPKKSVGGETVFLCCGGCEGSLVRMRSKSAAGKEAPPP